MTISQPILNAYSDMGRTGELVVRTDPAGQSRIIDNETGEIWSEDTNDQSIWMEDPEIGDCFNVTSIMRNMRNH